MPARLPCLLAAPPAGTGRLWLTNARLFDGTGAAARDGAAVLVEDGHVARVGEAAEAAPEDATILDLRGRTLMPGLIDAHAHAKGRVPALPEGAEPIWPGTAAHFLAADLRETLRRGITTMRDVGSFGDIVVEARQAMRLGAFRGPRLLTCGRIVSATAPGGVIFGSMYREADGPWEMRKAVREQIRRGADYVKFMATGARSVVAEDPEPAQMTLEEMTAIVDEAHRMGRRVAAHAEGLAGTRWALEAGADTIEHGLSLHRDPALLDAMAARGTVLVPTLSTFHDLAERFASDFAPPLVEQAKRQLDEALRTVAAARAAGVTLALGYDSGPPGASANELLRLAEAGLSSLEALAAATLGGAAALGRPELGRVAVGGPADLVVVEGAPDLDLGLLTRPESIVLVRKGGVPVALG